MIEESLKHMVEEDLARSGLTLDDLKGEILDGPAVRRRLGLDSRIPAKGGYSIPYFGLEGNPIMDSGLPFERFRLVGIEAGSEIGKYMAPVGTRTHLYIPIQLRQAVQNSAVGPVLVITEGEKKAVASCKAGIPCVALPGITNYRSREDKDKLHEEIRDLLALLQDNGSVNTVDVVFDSDGYPLKAANLPSDDEAKALYTEIKSGMNVRNKDVFSHAFKLANLIRQSIAGLKVGYGWCQPAFSTQTGPKGGKVKIVDKAGLDDVLVAGRVKEVQGWIESIAERAKEGDGEGGYLPLGMLENGTTAVLWSIPQGRLVRTGVASLTNSGVLAAICGRAWLEQKFIKYTKEGAEIDVKSAAADIASACAVRGTFRDGDRVFGTGVWSPDKKTIVVNTHNAVYLANGETIERIDEDRREIFLSTGNMTPPAFHPVSDEAYFRVCDKISDDLDTWTWESERISPLLVVGWMTMVVYLGLVERRPHVWLVGPRGSGKSRLLSYLMHMLHGYIKHTDMGSAITEAGIRQMLQDACFAFILDELEKENTENGHKLSTAIDQVLKIMRAAYSASSTVFKGTADQHGKEFRIQTSVMAASISEPALEPADRTRIVMVKLKPRQGMAGQPPKNLSPEESATFFWGTIQRYGRFQHIYEVVQQHWTEFAGNGDGREAETFGTILAAGMVSIQSIQTDTHILTALRGMISKIQPQLDEVRQGTAEHEVILRTLLTQNVSVEYHETDDQGNGRVNRETRSVGGLLRNIVEGGDNPDEIRTLALLGIAVKQREGASVITVPLRHSGLLALLKGSRYNKDGAWAGGLKDVPGSVWGHSAKISGQVMKCVLVPVAALPFGAVVDDQPAGSPVSRNMHPASTTLN
ncbi:DUF3854 domain-containing protein [Acidithiobacillus sp.]